MNPVPANCDRRPAGQREKVFQHAVSKYSYIKSLSWNKLNGIKAIKKHMTL